LDLFLDKLINVTLLNETFFWHQKILTWADAHWLIQKRSYGTQEDMESKRMARRKGNRIMKHDGRKQEGGKRG
jgi:hypothetical protein